MANNFDIWKEMSKRNTDICMFDRRNIETVSKRGKKDTDWGFMKIAIDNVTAGKLLASMMSANSPRIQVALIIFNLDDFMSIKSEFENINIE